jgi:hypothetical protein
MVKHGGSDMRVMDGGKKYMNLQRSSRKLKGREHWINAGVDGKNNC